MHAMGLDAIVRVAKVLAAADRQAADRGEQVWSTLTVDEQVRYSVLARVAIEEYLAAIADARTV